MNPHHASEVIYLPVLYELRDFRSKFMTALKLCGEERACLVGAHNEIRDVVFVRAARGGAYIGYNMFLHYHVDLTETYEMFKSRQVDLFHFDEEGAVFDGREPDWRLAFQNRFDIDNLSPPDQVWTWGDWQRELYSAERREGSEVEVVTVGHPRFDLCREPFSQIYAGEVARIKAQYGDYILINTKMVLANPGSVEVMFSGSHGYRQQGQDFSELEAYLKRWRSSSFSLGQFIELVVKLVKNPEEKRTIIVRPHPAENIELYKRALPFDQVHVLREGNVVPWTLGSDVVVHDGSTTSLEAYCSGRPAIYFHGPDAELNYLPSVVSACTSDIDEAVEHIRNPQPLPRDLPELALGLLDNLRAGADDSLSRISELVDAAPQESLRGALLPLPALRSAMASLSAYRRLRALKDRDMDIALNGLENTKVGSLRDRREDIDEMIEWGARHFKKRAEVEFINDRLMVVQAEKRR